ncbi:cyclic beta 1-2 glucan synthetase [Clostridium niameyense]|uniref:Cyclic beta 1-2 glucan synthetase n=1 Tax=Clostridium niameyense TaxID=1622073 RepID=A0A6M0RB38_9CLOT|nr:glucoamylase family protein [Clostridium niameyense]NEZ46769.1 cyclic beta 1-2 glucan synthetase [Clostridium niameyense]
MIYLIALYIISTLVMLYLMHKILNKEEGNEGLMEDINNKTINLEKEKIEEYASTMAESYSVVKNKRCKKLILEGLERSYSNIIKNYKYVSSLSDEVTMNVPAGEWLLDNIFLIEKEYKNIKGSMPPSYYMKLPVISHGIKKCYPRIYNIALEMVLNSDGIVDEDTIIRFINSYEKNSVLTTGEIWALPIMLRIALIQRIALITGEIVYIQNEKQKAEKIIDEIISAVNKNNIEDKLKDINKRDIKITPYFLEKITSLLKDNAIEEEKVYNWVNENVEKNEINLDSLINLSHRKQAKQQLVIGNCIVGIRQIEAMNWKKIFEDVSLVESILKEDPAKVYKNMDFNSKDFYRHTIENLSRKFKLSETYIAKKAIQCAKENKDGEDYKKHVGYYILEHTGIECLKKSIGYRFNILDSIKNNLYTFKQGYYIATLVFLSLIFDGCILLSIHYGTNNYNILLMILEYLILLVPCSHIVISIINWSLNNLLHPSLIPKVHFGESIPEEYSTVVVIPTLINNKKRAKELIADLEVYYLANREKNLYFAVLGDFKDSANEIEREDKLILETALKEVKRLNDKYAKDGEEIFYFLNRYRQYNEKENLWMGWERKRGKLVEFNKFIRGDLNTSYNTTSKNIENLQKVKYVITLDADTKLPRDSAKKLIGSMAHVLNKPLVSHKNKKVLHGYGLMQPKINIDVESADKTLFSSIFSGEVGFDNYTTAVSDVYQDLFGEGIFTGKGIYDVDVFNMMLEGEVPENAVLSHDLLEGSYVRAALVTDVQLVDGYPAYYNSSCKRIHRWVRGDWQLLPWINKKNSLNKISRWKMVDNLRRSLVSVSIILLVFLSLLVNNGTNTMLTVAFISILCPILFNVSETVIISTSGISLSGKITNIKNLFKQVFLLFVFLPHKAYLMMDAIIRTLYRLCISKKKLLEWQTAEDAERLSGKNFISYVKAMWMASLISFIIFFLAFKKSIDLFLLLMPSCILWFISPYIGYLVSKDKSKKVILKDEQKEVLFNISRRTWSYFEDLICDETNWLAPDNFQEEPYKGIAYRTSPTNMGMGLVSNISACDLGFIGLKETVYRIDKIISSMNELDKYQGHFYNWYDIKTKKPLSPKYISSVDSGNLVGYLWVTKQGIEDILKDPIINKKYIDGLVCLLELANKELKEKLNVNDFYSKIIFLLQDIKFDMISWNNILLKISSKYEELKDSELNNSDLYWNKKLYDNVNTYLDEIKYIMPWKDQIVSNIGICRELSKDIRNIPSTKALINIPKELDKILKELNSINIKEKYEKEWINELRENLNNSKKNINSLLDKINDLIIQLENLANKTDFNLVYNRERNLFSIGFNVEIGKMDNSYYDLLASEARQTSFVAIAKGDIPQENWSVLGRGLTYMGNGLKGLASWSGTMFEYFMPLLIMKNYPNTLLDQTYNSVIKAQKNYTKNIPWGISESGYYNFDADSNYQYKAFGVPGIGIKRGLSRDLVISPYSTILALQRDVKSAMNNINKLISIKTLGRYGFYEAIDYTKNRLSKEQDKAVVKSFMVHHEGMSLMALDNVLNNNILQKRFHSIPAVKATELLLQEKKSNRLIFTRNIDKYNTKIKKEEIDIYNRIYDTAKTEIPRVSVLSNGSYSLMISNRGAGYSKKGDVTLYRWREDVTSDDKGMFFYIKDINSGEFWSSTYEPCKCEGEEYKAIFYPNEARFIRKDGDIITKTQIVVSQENDAEIRQLYITNNSESSKFIEITSYCETTLSPYNVDLVHPTFSNLFVKTQVEEEPFCILGNRRPRSKKDKSPWIMQTVTVKGEQVGDYQYETSRMNFIGRNRNLYNPKAMDNDYALKNFVGAVLDPIISIRVRIKLNKGETCEVAYTTAFANTKKEAIDIAKKYKDHYNIKKSFDLSWTQNKLEMKYLGIKSTQANIYQYILSNVLFINNTMKEREKYIENIRGCQSNLWAYGISGDYPIILVTINDEKDIDIIRQLITCYRYWRMRDIKIDLVIVNTKESSYIQPVENTILDLINSLNLIDNYNKSPGIFLYNNATMAKEDLELLKSISRLYIDSKKGSLLKQIDIGSKTHKQLEVLNPKEKKLSFPSHKIYVPELKYYNNIGGFDRSSNEYIININNDKTTPMPWINVISNQNFGFHVSESGSSYSWYKNSRENKITNWCNDPVIDGESEQIYIRDEETKDIWSISPKPIRHNEEYIIRHGFGYSIFENYHKGIMGSITMFCPKQDNCKVCVISLKNYSDTERKLSITYYAELVLGVSKQLTSQYIATYHNKEKEFIYANNGYSSNFKDTKAYMKLIGGDNISFTGDRKSFLGIGGTIENPIGLDFVTLDDRTGAGMDPCMAENIKISMQPKEEKVVVAILGAEDSLEDIYKMIDKYNKFELCFEELNKVKAYWKDLLGTIRVKTPDDTMDIMLNGWLLYQVISCRLWSRTAFYQSGGAYGFRDQLQDVMALSYIDPKITRKQIIYSASRQFKEGDVQHWWHPVVESGIRTRFSDDLLWLPYVTLDYIKNTGDYSILKEEVNYLEDEPLKEGEDERYTVSKVSNDKGTIYEHCIKAINRSLKFGKHKIPLMGSGDWNDGMSTVGNKGEGESVWLGWFLYKILSDFIHLCDYEKDEENSNKYMKYIEYIKENIEKNAWDGNWYRRAYFDDGTALGSIENEECSIDSLSQSWAVLSGASKISRAEEAMEAVEKNLVRKEKGIIALLTPPFDRSKLEPGYIKGYLPGVRENGGQYTHAAIWVALAFSKLKKEDKAWYLFNMINPINHSRSFLDCENYKVEPYVMCADIYDVEPNVGRGGWSWYTGAASWMYRTGIEGILGLKIKENQGFYIDPCIPKEWRSYEMFYKKDEAEYHITVLRNEEKGTWLNGEKLKDSIVPFYNKGKYEVKVYI